MTVPSVLAIPALDTVYPTQLNTSIKEMARRRVGIETWLWDERQRSEQGQWIFLFYKSRLLTNEKESLSSGLKRPGHAAFRVQG